MSSECSGSPDPVGRLADVLTRASQGVQGSQGARPTPLELAELLWLAGHMIPADSGRTAADQDATVHDTTGPDAGGQTVPEQGPPSRSPSAEPPSPRASPERHPEPEPAPAPGPAGRSLVPSARVPLHLPSRLPAPEAGRPHTTLLAPAPPMLRHPLALQRALRPLGRRVEAPVGHELDERATADRIARLGAAPEWWLPVTRPPRERWLRLNLVYDTGPTMPVWRPLIRELHTALAQSGVFRTVALYRAAADGTVRGPGAYAPGDGRTVTLLISDCMGPQWREGPAGTLWYATLHRWARRMPLAVVQPLPEHLWRDTALPTTPGRLSAPHPAAPTATLAFTPYEPDDRDERDEPGELDGPYGRYGHDGAYGHDGPCGRYGHDGVHGHDAPYRRPGHDEAYGHDAPYGPYGRSGHDDPYGPYGRSGHAEPSRSGPTGRAVPLPVLEPGPRWLAHWAALLTTPGGAEYPAAVARLGRPLPADAEDRTDVGLLSAEELVLRFRATASPEAVRLAAHLAVGRPDLPVMRLVQAAVEPDPRPRHLAEVILSGMLTAVPGGPLGSYAFRDGVRDLLLLGLPRTARNRTTELLERMGEFIDRRAGRAPGEFRASVPSTRGAGTAVEGDPFATVSQDSVRRLSPADIADQPADPREEPVGAEEEAADAREELLEAEEEAADPREEPVGTGEQPADARDEPVGTGEQPADAREELLEAEEEAAGAEGRAAGARGAIDAGEPVGAAEQLADAEAQRADAEGAAVGPGEEDVVGRSGILFTADALAGRPEARITLEAAVHEILARGSLTPRQYEVEVRPDGYLVHTEPGAYLLPVLVAVLRELPRARARLTDPPRLRVTFGRPPAGPPPAAADVMVVVPPALYDAFTASSAAQGTLRFRPLYRDEAPDTAPVAWYCPLAPLSAEPRDSGLVQGPLITHDLRELGIPTPGRTAIVHTTPDGPLTVLDPIRPYGSRPPRPETYYSVDLTPHRARHTVSLPSSGPGVFTAVVELSWHVDDPVAFVRAEITGVLGVLLEHLRGAATRITRRHPLRRAAAAQRQVNTAVRNWPVPGLSVSYTVQLAPEGKLATAPERSVPSRRRLASLLGGAETVLIGFEGPLARLFPAQAARAAVLDLLSLVAEHRAAQDAPAVRPLPVPGAGGREAFAHPLDLLRAYAHDRLGPRLRSRLDELEIAAAPDAPTTHRSLALVRALHGSGRRVGVVTDVSSRAAHRCLEPYRLPLAGIHGRHDDLDLLMPNPDCLLRAASALGAPVRSGVLISSSVAELTAAQQLGLHFVGYAPTAAGRRRLRDGGSDITVSSLEPLLEAVRAL
ncbi:SAV_2336 N-terminal domain-related protein [Streptomyces sp. NPDC096012]|uniref:SAV_2336 N-terminal domain-related protein n=1 Tax=Streptomyces sp. NPDC096012 TaxID=3155684 RepID=UPI00336A256E